MITNPSAIFMDVPQYKVDNIIGIHTGSFNIGAPTSSPVNATQPFTTGFGDTCLFQGVFSTDSGATWNDFGANRPNLTTPGQPVLQTVTCQGYTDSSGVFTAYGTNYYDFVHSVGTAYTINYKVVFLAKDDQGPITPLATNEILQYDSSANYQKIFMSGSGVSTTTTPLTITHSLGYVPKVRAWFTSPSDGTLRSYDWLGSGGGWIYITTTTATFFLPSGSSNTTIYYRIYLDS